MSNRHYARLFLHESGTTEKEKLSSVGEVITKELNKVLQKNHTPEELKRFIVSPHMLNDFVEKRFREITNKLPDHFDFKIHDQMDYVKGVAEFRVFIEEKVTPFRIKEGYGLGVIGRESVATSGSIDADRITSGAIHVHVEPNGRTEARRGHGSSHPLSWSYVGPPPAHFENEYLGTWHQEEFPNYTEQLEGNGEVTEIHENLGHRPGDIMDRQETFTARPYSTGERQGASSAQNTSRFGTRDESERSEVGSIRSWWSNLWRGRSENE